MESDLVTIGVAVAVIYIVYRFASKGSTATGAASGTNPRNAASLLGFRPKNATQAMIDSVQSAFPDIPRANIHFDLLRTGSVDVTVNKLLERGFLDAPSAGYLRAFPPPPHQDTPVAAGHTPAAVNRTKKGGAPSLIERFGLSDQIKVPTEDHVWNGTGPIPSHLKGKGKEISPESFPSTPKPPKVSTTSVWESTPEKRQEALKARKQEMILAARKRLLEQEATAAKSTP